MAPFDNKKDNPIYMDPLKSKSLLWFKFEYASNPSPNYCGHICFVFCKHSYDILGAGMLWKPEEARILKKFINQRVNIR
jgi:hypothetical protein